MATATVNTKVKAGVGAKEQLTQAKTKMKDKIRAAKEAYKTQKQNIKTAKKIGYASGSKDYKELPKGKGMTNAAKKGYGNALKDSKKHEDLGKKLNGGR